MARGHKTGGRQKGTPNKRKAEYDAGGRHVVRNAARGGMRTVALRSFDRREGGSLPPPKLAPRAEEGGDHELTIKIIGGLPE
jgi:hypothetical protein